MGVYLDRGPYLVASLVAVHLTGAAYVPLDPLYPADRIGAMLADARAAAVLTSASGGLADEIGTIVRGRRVGDAGTDGDFEPPVVSLADEDVDLAEVDAKEGCDFGALAAVARPDDLAYVIFTSGSTGRPKGVQVTHANFMNFIYSMEEITGVDANVVLCAVTTVCFDIAGLELFLPLCVGGRTVLASRETAADPARTRGPHRAGGRQLRAGHSDHVAISDSLVRRRGGDRPSGPAAPPRHGTCRRRGCPGGARRRHDRRHAGRRVQRLRPDGDDGLEHVRRHRSRAPDLHRSTGRQHVRLRGGRRGGRRGKGSRRAGARGRRRGDLHRRRGRVAWVRRPRRSHRRKVPARPVLRRSRRAFVPHRRLGQAPTGHARARVPRAAGPPGEDPRLQGRAGRDRDRARRATACGACGGRGARLGEGCRGRRRTAARRVRGGSGSLRPGRRV